MPEQPQPGQFPATSAWLPPTAPVPPAPDLQLGRITFAHTAQLRKIAELLELARQATTDEDMLPLLDEAIELANQHD